MATIVVSGCGRSDNGVNTPDAAYNAADVANTAADAAADANAAAGGAANEAPTARQWWIANADSTACIDGGSPADKIKGLREQGAGPSSYEQKDMNGNIVYVQVDGWMNGGQDTFWKFYPNEVDCENAVKKENGTAAELQ
ncbi:MAG: hypothetical protein ACR2F8_13755 [Caulobacteraceae bacterium]